MRRAVTSVFAATIILAVPSWTPSAEAQVTTATISGTVMETSQAVVPGTSITITNVDTGVGRTTVTDPMGRYRVSNLAIGPYQVEAELDGFKKEVRTGIILTAGREAVVNFTLQVGQITEEVVVTGEAPLVNTTTGEVSGLVDQKTISELPLNGRDLMQLMTLEPGVGFVRGRTTGVSQGGSGQRATINGSRETQTLFLLDGSELNDTLGRSPGGEAGVFMGAEAVQEFKVILHNFSAEYGRAAGGVFNAVTKSGTNVFRGSGFEFYRNSKFDALNFFDEEKLPFHRHQYGFSLGGPIAKNRIFFFANYEGLRDRLTETRVLVVPSAAGRQGILGNTVVSVNPVVLPYLALYPLPNGRDFGDGTGELSTPAEQNIDEDYVTSRVDFRFGKNAFFVRHTYDDSTKLASETLPDWPDLSQTNRNYVTAEYTRILKPTLLYVARMGYSRSRTGEDPVPVNPHSELAFGTNRDKMGRLRQDAFADAGAADTDLREFTLQTWQASNTLLWSQGAHQIKAGVDLSLYRFRQVDSGAINGEYRFTSLANFLRAIPRQLGVAGVGADEAPDRTFTQNMIGGYAQYDYQVRPNLTLNLGLRYEVASVPEEVDGRWATLVSLTDPQTTTGHPIFANPTTKNFAPRVGVAWDPKGDGRTSVRGGFGVFYDPPLTSHWRNRFNNAPFRREVTLRNVVFPNSLDVELNRYIQDNSPSNVFLVEPNPASAYVMQYNVTVQREIGSATMVAVGYTGHTGRNQMSENDLNIATPVILDDGRKFFPAGSQLLNPNFARMRVDRYNSESRYDGLMLQVTHRLTHGLQAKISYALSRTMDHTSLMNRGDGGGNSARTFQDPYDLDAEWALSDLHGRHRLVANGTYVLPVGQDTRLGGWQIGAILTVNSGIRFTPIVGFDRDRNQSTDLVLRPNRVPGVEWFQGGVDQYFNPAAFALQEPGFYGDAGRNIMESPGLGTLDLSVMKSTRLWGDAQLQARFEIFNALNRANFGVPLATVFDSGGPVASAGRITDTVTPGRQMQLGVKLLF